MRQARKKILFIEDDRETAALITEELVERGFDVHVAFDGVEGFSAILKVQPDLVLSGISMPAASGFEVLQWLAAATPRIRNVPFIFLTAMTGRDVELQARRLGADGFVTKPVDFDVLEAVITGRLASTARTGILRERRRERSLGGIIGADGARQIICRYHNDSPNPPD
jgi:DNA-binding response OmpR family regulator